MLDMNVCLLNHGNEILLKIILHTIKKLHEHLTRYHSACDEMSKSLTKVSCSEPQDH